MSHSCAVPSTLMVARVWPSWLNATLRAGPTRAEITLPVCCRVLTFHSRTVSLALALARVLPFGLNAMLAIEPEVPNGAPVSCCVLTFQIRMASATALARVLPSGLNAMLAIEPEVPNGPPVSRCVARFQSRMAPPASALARISPAGLNAMLSIAFPVPARNTVIIAGLAGSVTSQSEMLPLVSALARVLPSGLNATPLMPALAGSLPSELCLAAGAPSPEPNALPVGRCVATFQSRMVPLAAAVARIWPSGLNATALTGAALRALTVVKGSVVAASMA
jgi:hypothetical protein